MSKIESPCVSLCVIDPSNGLCRGCARTIAEIGGWTGMGASERRAVMNALPLRQAQQQQQQ